jgi:peptide/nickel transport system permease protein
MSVWWRFRRHRLALFGFVVLGILVMIAVFAPLLDRNSFKCLDGIVHDRGRISLLFPEVDSRSCAAYGTDIGNTEQGPSLTHLLGTDKAGRDVWSRIVFGARISLAVGIVAALISSAIGTLIGLVAGYAGRWIDSLLMRFTEIVMTLPTLFLLLIVSSLFGRSVVHLMIIIGLLGWTGKARLVRGQVLSLKEMGFIRAERALGVPQRMIITKHLVPNAISPIVVSVSAGVGGVMLTESTLSFLGLGIQPPAASWGNMVSENLTRWRYDPHLVVMPGMVLAIAVFGFNFLGDGLNDALNPRAIQR